MTDYPGTYRARCVSVKGDKITAYVPQVFGDERITITSRTGDLPDPNSNGWVMFESAQASLPVWVSSAVTGSTVTRTESSAVPEVVAWNGVTFAAGTSLSVGTITIPVGASVISTNGVLISSGPDLNGSEGVLFDPVLDSYVLGGGQQFHRNGQVTSLSGTAVVSLPGPLVCDVRVTAGAEGEATVTSTGLVSVAPAVVV